MVAHQKDYEIELLGERIEKANKQAAKVMQTKSYVQEERRVMRQQITREKEMMSHKFSALEGSANYTQLLTQEFSRLTGGDTVKLGQGRGSRSGSRRFGNKKAKPGLSMGNLLGKNGSKKTKASSKSFRAGDKLAPIPESTQGGAAPKKNPFAAFGKPKPEAKKSSGGFAGMFGGAKKNAEPKKASGGLGAMFGGGK